MDKNQRDFEMERSIAPKHWILLQVDNTIV